MVPSACLDEDTILAFAEGRLAAPAVRDLEAHARTCATCSELLAATLGVVHGSEPRPAAPAPIARGTAIGRYVVLAEVGRGGMGEVFAAFDPELDRKVAVKLLHTEARSNVAHSRSRLLREAKAIARLSHPNVVVVHDAGTFGDQVFVAMEFVDGQTVAAWLAERTRGQREILDVFLAAARGLAAAHAAGLVHRDFKPHNVMVTRAGSVRVMDFGLARSLDDHLDDEDRAPDQHGATSDAHGTPARWDVTLTQTGELLGTPLYMAPEQFLGRAASAQADQFSFCVALYHALYGAHPFRHDTLADLMTDVCQGKVLAPPPKTAVPTWLRRVLLRGLSVDAAARWPSMTALMQALQHDPARVRRRALWTVVALAALTAAGVGVARATRHPSALCQAGAARLAAAWETDPAGTRHDRVRTAFLATGLGYAAETWDRAAALLDGYASRWVAMYRDSCEATHVRGEQSTEVLDLRTACLDERLTRMDALVDVFEAADRDAINNAVAAASALPTLDRCADVKLLRSPVEPPASEAARVQVEGLRRRAATVDALNLTGKHEAALEQGHRLVGEARTLGYRPLLAELLVRQWAFVHSSAFGVDAAKDLEEASWLALATRRDDVAAEAGALLVGVVGYHLARHEDGERWASFTEAILERLGPGHDVTRAWTLQNRADISIQTNDLDAALAFTRQALALKRKALPPESTDIGASMAAEAEILFRRGDAKTALAVEEDSIAIWTRAYGPNSPWLANLLGNKGEYLVALGRLDEALVAFDDALARWETLWGPTHAFLAYPLTGIGVARWKQGRSADALAPLERALAIREASEPDAATVAETRFALARALWDAGRDRKRALALAATVRTEYERHDTQADKAREVAAWIAARTTARIAASTTVKMTAKMTAKTTAKMAERHAP
jgi:tetratricopeptide (TPR) repeat protein